MAASGSEPLVTIVVGNYNYDQFVADAIDSALAQSYRPLEVIVVDDGSTDSSRDIISRYAGRVRTILQDNEGHGAVYNAGWLAARGDFVLFLDSDDTLTTDALHEIVAAFRQSAAVKVQFYLAKVDRHLRPLGSLLPSYEFSPLPARRQIENYGYYVCPPASGNAYRKSFLDQIMPIANKELYRRAADGYTTGLAGLDGGVLSLSKVLGYYRVHGTNFGGESGVSSLSQLHHMIMRDVKREDTQHAFADQFSFRFPRDRSRYCPGHVKLRLLSQRLAPELHPIASDNVANLVKCGLVSALTFPHLKLAARVRVAVGILGLGLSPRRLLRKYFASITSPRKRNLVPGAL